MKANRTKDKLYLLHRMFLPLSTVVLSALLFSSCAFSRLKSDVKAMSDGWVLDIHVDMDDGLEGDAVAVVYTPYKDGERIAAFKIVDPAIKRTLFLLDPGEYRLALFHDRNGNLNIDEGEPAALAERGRRLKFSDVVKRIEMKVSLPEHGELPSEFPRELAALPDKLKNAFALSVGDLMDLNDPRFSREAGRMGLWEPTRFLREYGFGIYMLGEFDPNKVPVLFVNGAGGSAQNWRYFFDHLDKDRFQAWFFLYPSGMRIGRIGNTLAALVRGMSQKFGFTRMHVVAHSMGGLVARDALVKHLEEDESMLIGQFVTISTPWNGHRMAEKGVSALSVQVPSWHDVVPGSPFLQTVFNRRLKGKVPHHLLFGYVVGSEGDGSVDLNSVLLNEAQDDATEVRGFEGDHVSVLSNALVFEYVEDILIEDKPIAQCPCPESDKADEKADEAETTDGTEPTPDGDEAASDSDTPGSDTKEK